MSNKVLYLMYILTAKWLPQSRHMKIAQKLRGFYVKHIAESAGNNLNIEKGAHFSEKLKIGDGSGIGVNCEIYGPVTLGNNVMMGPEVVIYTSNHMHKAGKSFGSQNYEIKPVYVGNNVWIGRRVMFMAGSSVGDNCVVAAGAVITKNFPDNVIVGGVPAKIVGYIE